MLTDLRCPPVKDVCGIVWPSIEAGLTSIQPCPEAADVGMFSHGSLCFSDSCRECNQNLP